MPVYFARHDGKLSVMKFVVILFLVSVLTMVGMTYKRWEGQPPEVRFDHEFKALGRAPALNLAIADSGTGIKHVTIRLKQKDQEIVLADEALNRDHTKSYDVGRLI